MKENVSGCFFLNTVYSFVYFTRYYIVYYRTRYDNVWKIKIQRQRTNLQYMLQRWIGLYSVLCPLHVAAKRLCTLLISSRT